MRQVNGDSQPTIGGNQVRSQAGGPPSTQHLSPAGAATNPPVEEIRYQGTELVMLYDYKVKIAKLLLRHLKSYVLLVSWDFFL